MLDINFFLWFYMLNNGCIIIGAHSNYVILVHNKLSLIVIHIINVFCNELFYWNKSVHNNFLKYK